MQGLITAAGLGIRAKTGKWFRKVMLPVYDVRDSEVVIRPIIDCVIERMESIGISDITVVLDPSDAVTCGYIRNSRGEVSIEYLKDNKGFGDAVLAGSKNISGRFFLNAGDGIILDSDVLKDLKESRFQSTLALMKVDNPTGYGVAECELIERGVYQVKNVEEKPKEPKSNIALAAVYVLDESVLGHISRSVTGTKIELTDAIRKHMLGGNEVGGILLPRGQWQSVGNAGSYINVIKKTYSWANRHIYR